MPRGDSLKTEQEAVEIVRREEIRRGWSPGPLLSKRQEAIEGCDFFSTPPDGDDAHPIEVKGWGESIFDEFGSFRYLADINDEQKQRAERDPNWRLEIVANLAAARLQGGQVERLTLTSADVKGRIRPWRHRIDLAGLESTVQAGEVPQRSGRETG